MRLRTAGLTVGFVALIALVIVGSVRLGNHILNGQPKTTVSACHSHGTAHTVLIENNRAKPSHTYGSLCDTMTIQNADNEIRLMAFGPHDNHQPYDGITEHVLGPHQSFSVVLNQAGTFHFHDHIHDNVTGDFTVVP